MSMLDNIFGVHENAMQLRQRRLSLLGENIANADTPNYKAKDLDFKALVLTLSFLKPSAQLINFEKSPEISGLTFGTSP